MASYNRPLMTAYVMGLGDLPPGSMLLVTLAICANGMLSITVMEGTAGRYHELLINYLSGLSINDIQAHLRAAAQFQDADEALRNTFLRPSSWLLS